MACGFPGRLEQFDRASRAHLPNRADSGKYGSFELCFNCNFLHTSPVSSSISRILYFSFSNTAFTRFIRIDDSWFPSVEVQGGQTRVCSARQADRSCRGILYLFPVDPSTGTDTGEASSAMLTTTLEAKKYGPLEPLPTEEWCAIQTRPRHERVVTHCLEMAGIATFLPLFSQLRNWSDRRKRVEFPLFPGYIFACAAWSPRARARVFQTNGVIGFVGPRKEATPIPVQQIEAIRTVMQARAEYSPHPYLTVGQRVRIRNGSLRGLEGILLSVASDNTLVVSIDLIHRSVAIRLNGYEVESL